jgi:hypothetical protein
VTDVDGTVNSNLLKSGSEFKHVKMMTQQQDINLKKL